MGGGEGGWEVGGVGGKMLWDEVKCVVEDVGDMGDKVEGMIEKEEEV